MSIVDQFGVSADAGRDYRQARGHRFQNGIRDSFRQRRQHKAMQAPHNVGNVRAFPRQPRQGAQSGNVQYAFDLCPQRPVADQDQAHTLPRDLVIATRTDKGIGKCNLILHRLHASHRADQPEIRGLERTPLDCCTTVGNRRKPNRVDAIANASNAARVDADVAGQVLFEIL